MAKNFILTEEQIRYIISEELGIAKEVVNLTNTIETKIVQLMSNNIDRDVFTVKTELSELTVDYLFKVFKSLDEYYDWYNVTRRKNGYSYTENTIYLTVLKVGNYINNEDLVDTIQHECSHYWECKSSGKNIGSNKYQSIIRGIENRNPVISTI